MIRGNIFYNRYIVYFFMYFLQLLNFVKIIIVDYFPIDKSRFFVNDFLLKRFYFGSKIGTY